MSRYIVTMSASLDGYIADAEGNVHWLEPFEKDDYGYEAFLGSIGAIIMGRVTYEQVRSFGPWPYDGIPTLVWTGRDLDDLPEGAESLSGGVEATASWLEKYAGGRDIWVLGGARTVNGYLRAGLIDRIELFIAPVLIGGGVRLFEQGATEPSLLKIHTAQPYANGVVQLTYDFRK